MTGISKCINCSLCVQVCSYMNDDIAVQNNVHDSYAAWSNDENVRLVCSSGGVGFEFGKEMLSRGYKVVGVRYNVKASRAEHYISTTENELEDTIGSKYIQSYTLDAFKSIDLKSKYLIIGTPCQIDSFRRYIRKMKKEDNFVLMDFFCHSVPSMLMWRMYLEKIKDKVGDIEYVSWRNKLSGWHDSWSMAVDSKKKTWHESYNIFIKGGGNEYNSKKSNGDLFYKLFLGDFCSNPACSKNCKFKYDQSSADIRIGDFWGNTFKDNEDGVSAVVAFTEKGKNLIESSDCYLQRFPFETVAEGQMKNNIIPAYTSGIVRFFLRHNVDFSHFVLWRIVILIEIILKKVLK